MNILLLSDIHGNFSAVSAIIQNIKSIEPNIDLILIAGDMPATTPLALMLEFIVKHPKRALSKTGYTEWVYKGEGRSKFILNQSQSVKKILDLLGTLDLPIVYIPGNVDCTEVKKIFLNNSNAEIYFLDCTSITLLDIEFIGVGGSEVNTNRYPAPLCDREYFPQQFKERVDVLLHRNKEIDSPKELSRRILISHEPPSFSITSPTGIHNGGSTTITNLINILNPDLAIFGHYHEIPLVKQANDRTYVNPGPTARYNYALVNLSGADAKVSLHKLSPPIRDTINLIYSISSYRTYKNVSPGDITFD
jgi:Icc-related predicted phosphoesterase